MEVKMNENIIKFTDVNVDGCGTDVTLLARVYGKDISVETIEKINDAIANYKKANEGEWDTDGCLDAATEQLEADGYEVHFVNPTLEIRF
jgi:hypothetical protein